MGNLPDIAQTEMAIVAAAVMVLFIAPGLLLWSDERRQRRARRAALAAETAAAAAAMPVVTMAAPTWEAVAASVKPADVSAVDVTVPTGSETPLPLPDEVAATTIAAIETPAAPEAPTPQTGATPAGLQPLARPARHHFRLDDLHAAQLPDWPPEAIRNDPERNRVRQETEQAAAQYQERINATPIGSPYPARSHSLGAASADAAELRLAFLLFPVLWPVSQNQAVAQAVFRIDRGTGEVRGWVDALRPQELSDENRREIREAGGEI